VVERRARPHLLDSLGQAVHVRPSVGVHERGMNGRSVGGLRDERALELREGTCAPAHALDDDDLAVGDAEDRLGAEQLAGDAGRTADPPTANEVLERRDREDVAGAAVKAIDERDDVLLGCPALEPALDRVREQHGSR
jgi:hypothetical protein